ncbi:MAG: tetratricopeptide repeat protein [Zetaproteobacteria bacterium]|nr:tetratricopeptide repeat protein [Zetaproteobacteria bacterium]
MTAKSTNAYIAMDGNLHFTLVEADPANAQAMAQQLAKFGYRNHTILPCIYTAMKHIIHDKRKCEFIICRYRIGDLMATDLLDELKNTLDIARAPILVFGTKLDEGDVALLEEKGADAFLQMPYISKEFAAKISSTWSRYIDPAHIEYKIEQARRLIQQDKLSEAITYLDKLTPNAGAHIHRVHFMQASVFAQRKAPDKALNMCEQILQQQNSFVHAYQLTGEIHYNLDRHEPALIAFTHAIDISPKNPFRYQVVADILLKVGHWRGTKEILQKAQAMGFEFEFVRLGLAKALIMLKEYPQALDLYLELHKGAPQDTDFMNSISVCYKHTGDINRAIQYYQKALDVEPENTKVMFNLALTYLKKDKEAKAVDLLRKILSHDPEHERAQGKLLQLTDPAGYQAFLAAQKHKIQNRVTQGASEPRTNENHHDSEITYDAQHPAFSAENFQTITTLLQRAGEIHASGPTTIRTVQLSSTTKEKITQMPEEEARYTYLNSMVRERKRFHTFMKGWFEFVQDLSEEISEEIFLTMDTLKSPNNGKDSKDLRQIVDDASHNLQAVSQALDIDHEKDQELYALLSPLVQQLQFQDKASQALNSVQRAFARANTHSTAEALWTEIRSYLISESAKKILDQSTGKQGADDKEEDNGDDTNTFFF